MAYHGLLPLAKQFLSTRGPRPSFIEIGVDRGVSFVTLATFLVRASERFLAVGIDVDVQEQVSIMLANLDRTPQQAIHVIQGNSLDVLPRVRQSNMRFDLVLLDGDHNYYTVARELLMVEGIINDDAMIIVDDYDGRWSERDLWYSTRPGYESNESVTKEVATEKHGVKPAVDEWLASRPEWVKEKPVQGEPIVLRRRS